MLYPNINAEIARDRFCKAVGVSYDTFKGWQSGKSEIPAKKLIKMAEILNCSTDYLLGFGRDYTA